MDIESLVGGVRQRQPAALARAISLVENEREGFEAFLSAVHPFLGGAQRIGITGPPGAGKSTLAEGLVGVYRDRGHRVGVVAVDPTSPFSGGALLGDRIRMERITLDPDVFIRSMATRGSLGGLAMATREVCDVLDAAGFDRILIETVGVGQSELDVARLADTSVLVLVPESGDGIQTLKSGIMEIGDIFVVNKADRPGADRLRQEIEVTLGIRRGNAFRNVPAHHGARTPPAGGGGASAADEWQIPVLATVAVKGDGLPAVVDALEAHWTWLQRTDVLRERRRRRLRDRTRQVVERALRQWVWRDGVAEGVIEAHLGAVESGDRSPYDLAAEVIESLKQGVRL